jgi:hypothetical protein
MLRSTMTSLPDLRIHLLVVAHIPRSMEKLLMDMAVEIASRVATAAADPVKDLGSMWATCSQMRRVCGDTVVG